MKQKITFREAWHLWRTGGKTMLGEPITFTTLLSVALVAFFEGTVHFFAEMFWKRIWSSKKKKEE